MRKCSRRDPNPERQPPKSWCPSGKISWKEASKWLREVSHFVNEKEVLRLPSQIAPLPHLGPAGASRSLATHRGVLSHQFRPICDRPIPAPRRAVAWPTACSSMPAPGERQRCHVEPRATDPTNPCPNCRILAKPMEVLSHFVFGWFAAQQWITNHYLK